MRLPIRITKRTPWWLIIISLAIGLAQYYGWLEKPGQVLQANQPGQYAVTRVFDGDTIEVDMNGARETIRLIGVDTPETQDPRKPVQCFGRAASDFTKELLKNQAVRLEADPLSQNRDRYDRLLRYAYLSDGRLIQAEIIRRGYGFAYTSFPFTKSQEFTEYQREARSSNRGLWASCELKENEFGGFEASPESQ